MNWSLVDGISSSHMYTCVCVEREEGPFGSDGD